MNASSDLRQTKLERIKELHRLQAGCTALLVIDMQHGFLDEGASLQVPKGREILPNVVRLVEACRQRSVPVIFTEFVYATTIPCLRGDPFGPEHLPAAPGQPTGFGHPSNNCLISPVGPPAVRDPIAPVKSGSKSNPVGRDVPIAPNSSDEPVGPRTGEGPESAATVDALAPRADELVVQAHTYDKFYGTHLDLALRSQGIDRLMVTGVTTDVCVNATIIAGATRNYRMIAVPDGMATIHDHIHESCLQVWENKFARIAALNEILDEMT
jgi:nicotinamidase-related amidase